MVFNLSALWWRRIRGSWKLPDGRDWLRGKLRLVLMGRATCSVSLMQISVVFETASKYCILDSFVDLRPNYSGSNEDNANLLQKVPCRHCWSRYPWPCSRPPSIHGDSSIGDSWTFMGKSGSVSCGVTAPFSWVLVQAKFCLCPPRVCFPSPV